MTSDVSSHLPLENSIALISHQSSPKVDLHRHLEGALRLETMLEVGSELGLDLPASREQLRPFVQIVDGEPRTALTLLSKFEVIRKFFQNDEIIRRFAREVIFDAAADGVRVLELRFTPAALAQESGLAFEEVIDTVTTEGREAAAQNGIHLGLILSINRHESLAIAEEVVSLAVDRLGKGINGIDLAGDEGAVGLDPFLPVFREAKQAGLKITIHAGEWGAAKNVADAIEKMGADRIGHGVRVMEDAGVLHLARTAGVGFEISPSSNIMTGVFNQLDAHPLSQMIDAGLRVAITTDDPSIFNTTLSGEHALVVEHLGLSSETIKGLTMQALQLSYFDAKLKRSLEKVFTESLWGSTD